MKLPSVLAFDAGGSRIRAVCAAADGAVGPLALGEAGPGNLKTLGEDFTFERLVSAAELARGSAGPELHSAPSALVVCLAGASAGSEGLEGRLAERFRLDPARVWVLPDYEALLAPGAIRGAGEPTVALIAGTGSIAVAVGPDGRRWRRGGLGPKSEDGDPGSAVWMARRIAERAGLSIAPGEAPAEIAGRLPAWLAAPPIPAEALHGLLGEAAQKLAELVLEVKAAAKLPRRYRLHLAGGFVLGSPALLKALEQRLEAAGHRPEPIPVPEPWRGALAWARALHRSAGALRRPVPASPCA